MSKKVRKEKVFPGPCCGSCKYFVADKPAEDTSGECYANPPKPLCNEEDIFSVRPFVEEADMPYRHWTQRLNS